MRHKAIFKTLSVFSVLAAVSFSVAYAQYKYDPFSAYKDFIKKPLAIKSKKLKHFGEEEQLIREKLKLDISQRERSILAGLHWIIVFADDEKNFKALFPDFMLLMDKMANSGDRIHQKEVAQAIIRKGFSRAYGLLTEWFDNSENAGWSFIGLFPLLINYPDLAKDYFAYYKKQWPDMSSKQSPPVKDFTDAMEDNNYKGLFDILVFTSFPHYYLKKAHNSPVSLPVDKFPQYLKAFEQFTYPEHQKEDPQFRNLGYLATHVPLVLTNYGEYALKQSLNAQKAQAYIESSFEKARQLGDFDLFAEYIQCLKIFNAQDPRIKELEKFIYSFQRPDGSWGSHKDFTTNAYTAIHPSGAALMALNQP